MAFYGYPNLFAIFKVLHDHDLYIHKTRIKADDHSLFTVDLLREVSPDLTLFGSLSTLPSRSLKM